MAVPKDLNLTGTAAAGSNCFKEAVCIDTKRIYDSISEGDGSLYILPVDKLQGEHLVGRAFGTVVANRGDDGF